MKRVITVATILLLLTSSFSIASAQCNGNGNGNGNGNAKRALLRNYVRKLDRLETRIDYATCVSHSLISAYSANTSSAQINQMSQQLRQSINRLNGPIQSMISLANNIGEQGLITETARLAVFPSLLMSAGSGSSSSALTAAECTSICQILDDMARLTGDDIRREVQEARINL